LPSFEWVIDTWLLAIAQNPLDDRSLDAVSLLHELKVGHRIALDHSRNIQREYYRNLDRQSHAAQWLNAMLRRADKTMWRAGCLSQERKRRLIDDLNFDRSDLIFVGVSSEGPDKLLVSEESDYSPEIKAYLLEECGVRVLSIREAIAIAS
jgi:hypothetical protein